MTKWVPRLGLAVVGSLLLLAACGGGDDEGAGEASVDEWCDLARELEASDLAFDDLGGDDPDAVEATVGELQAVFDRAARVAPDQILADVNTSADGVDTLADLLADAEYDVARIDAEAVAELDAMGADIDAATERITQFNAEECGIEPEPTPTTEPDDLAADPDSAWCVAAREVRAASDALDADQFDFTDPASVEQAFDELLAAFDSAIATAPDEIADSVRTSYDGFLELRDALASVDYDFLRADLSVIEESDAEMDAANGRIEEYNAEVCGIPADDGDEAEPGDATDDESTDEFDPSAGSIRDQVIADLVAAGFTEEEAGCIIDSMDLTDPDLASDMNAMFQVFEECGIDLERLAELAG